MARFKPTPMLHQIKPRVLLALSRTVMAAVRHVCATSNYVEIDSEHGHLASGMDAAKWTPALRALLEALA